METNDKTIPGEILDLGSDEDKQVGQQNRAGIRLETKEIIDTLQCRLSAQTAGVITAYLTDDSGTVIERQTVATLKGGDTFEFEAALKAGKSYWILCDAQGYDYSRGRTTTSYPLESNSLVVTHGIYNGSGAPSNTYRYCIDQIHTSNTAAEKGAAIDLATDDETQSWNGLNKQSGIRFRARRELLGLECRISAGTNGLTIAYLTDDSGTILEQRSITEFDSGETFRFSTRLAATETYWVVCDANGADFSRGRAEVDYPLESDSLAVTHGIYAGDGTQSETYRYCLDLIQPTVLATESETVLDLREDDEVQSWNGLNKQSGVRIETTASIDGLICRLSENTTGLTTAYLTTDSGDVLERQTIATLKAGNSFTFDTSLSPAEAYWIVCDARGDDYIRGRAEVTYPVRA
ncbi:hypothetical protein ACFQE6_07535, partial [Natrinema soli]